MGGGEKMKRTLLVVALALILVQVGAYAPTVTLTMAGDTGKMLLPASWNVNAESLGERIDLALALNREGCYSPGYYLFNHERECLLWLSFPVYANPSMYSENPQVKLIGILRVYGGVKSVAVKRVAVEGKQWIEFAAGNGTRNTGQYTYQHVYSPKQTRTRHYPYLTTSHNASNSSPGYHSSASRIGYSGTESPRHADATAANQASYLRPRTVRHYANATTASHAGYLTPRSQTSTRHYSHYSGTRSQTAVRHYTYYSMQRPAVKTSSRNTYSRYYHRDGSSWLAARLE